MNIDQFDIWASDVVCRQEDGTSSLFLLVLQNSTLNEFHPTVIVCPITTHVIHGSEILRVHIPKEKEATRIEKDCDVVIDQIRVIDIKHLINREGKLPLDLVEKVKNNIKIVMDMEL